MGSARAFFGVVLNASSAILGVACKFSETASRVCTDIPDSVDVDSPRIVQAEVIFSRQTAVDGIPLRTDAPANVRQLR